MLNKDDFSALAHSRRSTRDFLPDLVSDADLDDVLEDGMSAPSWSNTRPFMFAIATGDQRDRISAALVARLQENAEVPGMGMNPDYTHETPYPTGLIERSQRVGKGIYDTLGIDRADKESRFRFMQRNYEFFGAPVALFFFAHRGLSHFGTLDLGLFMETAITVGMPPPVNTKPFMIGQSTPVWQPFVEPSRIGVPV